MTLDVYNRNRSFGYRKDDTFDITVRAQTEAGEAFLQEVFMNVNG